MDVKLLDPYFSKMNNEKCISMNFNKKIKTVSYMIGGNRSIKTYNLDKNNPNTDLLFDFLEKFSNNVDSNLLVIKYECDFLVKKIDCYDPLEYGFDELQLKLIDVGITRVNGLSVVSSNKYANIPFFLREMYCRIRTRKPDLNIMYITSEYESINHNVDILFIEDIDVLKSFGKQIKDVVLSGVPVITGIVAGNSIFGLQRISNYIDHKTLGSFSFLNTMIHLRSVPLTCNHCCLDFDSFSNKDSKKAQELLYRVTRLENDDNVPVNLVFHGKGCDHCNDGLLSEVICSDVIVPDYDMMDLIKNNDFSQAWRSWRRYHVDGIVGRRYEDHAFEKMKSGIISPIIVEEYFEMLNIQVLLEDGVLTSDEVESLTPPI